MVERGWLSEVTGVVVVVVVGLARRLVGWTEKDLISLYAFSCSFLSLNFRETDLLRHFNRG